MGKVAAAMAFPGKALRALWSIVTSVATLVGIYRARKGDNDLR